MDNDGNRVVAIIVHVPLLLFFKQLYVLFPALRAPVAEVQADCAAFST